MSVHLALVAPTACDHVEVRLADGGTARLRPLARGDEATVSAVFDGLSPASRALRFLATTTQLTAPMLQLLADVDGWAHVAWFADVDGLAVGVARYVRVSADTAEIAVEVADVHHRRGIGSALMDAVVAVAHANGVSRLTATAYPTNAASVRLLRRLGVALRLSDGLLEGDAPVRLPARSRVDLDAVLDLAARSDGARAAPLRG
jgi:GNAT superfamily N-acetyltransferase